MPSASPLRLLRRFLPALPIAFFGCSDASAPVEPRLIAPPQYQLGPAVTVTNADDAGPGSLRQAIIDAPDGATIQFDAGIAGGTVVLSTGDLQIDKALTIEGPVPAGMTISGGLSSRVFRVTTSGNVVLRNLSIVDGRDKFAGGIWVEGTATLDHSLVANNEAAEVDAGGIFVNLNGELTLVNTTVSGNVTPGSGGGIYSSGSLSIRNSTIAFNASAKFAGGVFVPAGSLSLRNTIIANNQDGGNSTANCGIDSSVGAVYAGRNLTNVEPCALSQVVASPELLPLASNGGPTRTHALDLLSAAIETGLACSETTDQRYVARPQGVTCDLGAYEFTDFGTFAITIGPNVAVNAKTGVITLTGTIVCSRPTNVSLLDVGVSQTQKTTGRFTTIVNGTGSIGVYCQASPTSWSVAVAPQSPAKFAPGSAIATATTTTFAGGFLSATVTSSVKAFRVK